MKEISKLEAANRQLCTAIRLFFDNGDAIAIHSLACAAREIYEKNCARARKPRMVDVLVRAYPDYTEKAIFDLINKARNFFKHGETSLQDKIAFSDRMNDFQILSACYDCLEIAPVNLPIEAQTIVPDAVG